MAKEKNLVSGLFLLETGPMKFYLPQDFEDPEILSTWVEQIEIHGGIVLQSATEDAVHLVDLKNSMAFFKSHNKHVEYDIKFISHSIKNNSLQDIQEYRIKIKTNENFDQEFDKDSPISLLNIHCLAEIFSYFPPKQILVLEKVSKKWHQATKLAWYNTKVLIYNTSFDYRGRQLMMYPGLLPEIEKILIRCGKYITHLNLNSIWNSGMINVVKQYCFNIINLNLAFHYKDEKIWHNAFSNMPKLETLSISLDEFVNFVPLSLMMSIQEKMGSLKSLTLDGLNRVMLGYVSFPSGFALPCFQNLHSLNFHFLHLTMENIKSIGQYEKLTTLVLNFCSTPSSSWIYGLGLALENVEYLRIYCEKYFIIDEELSYMVKKCKKLKKLELRDCSRATDFGVRLLAELEELKEIELAISDAGLISDSSIRMFRNLKSFQVCSAGITQDGIISLVENSPDLEYLELAHTSFETLSSIARITRKRTNNIVLILEVSILEREEYAINSRDFGSPYLEVVNTRYYF